jgi:hypothetical protein
MGFTFYFDNKKVPEFRNLNLDIFNRVLLGDSIGTFFPRAEINITDNAGIFSELVGLIEGEEFTFYMGDDTDITKAIQVDMVMDDNNLTESFNDYHVSGNMLVEFIHKNKVADSPKSKSYQGTPTLIAEQLMAPYKYNDLKTAKSGNIGVYGQGLVTDERFLLDELLPSASALGNNEGEPFFTFVDLRGGFHFETITNMLIQPSVETFYMTQDQETVASNSKIEDMNVVWTGLNKDLVNMNSNFYYIDNNGAIQKQAKKLTDMPKRTNSGGVGQVPILRNVANTNRSNRFFGFVDKTHDINKMKTQGDDDFKAWMATFYVQQQTMMVLRIVVRGAHPNAIAGKNVTLKIDSMMKDTRGQSTEYSGKWAIAESKHFFDFDFIPYTELHLVRNYIDYSPLNLYKNDLL